MFSVEKEEHMKEFDEELLTFNLTYTGEGVEVYCRSRAFEDYFKGRATNNRGEVATSPDPNPTGLTLYNVGFIEVWGAVIAKDSALPLIVDEDLTPNFSFLRAVGLGNGITFLAKEVVPPSGRAHFESTLIEAVKSFYKEYLCVNAVNVRIYTKGSRTIKEKE